MPGLNNPAMIVAADAMRAAMRYAQLHWASAGSSGTSSVTTAARQSISWAPATLDGDFGLASGIAFTGGAPNGAVYSVSLWSAATGGTFYGEFILSGNLTFNSAGTYTVSAINLDGSATWQGLQDYGNDPRASADVRITLPNPGKATYPILRPIRQAIHQ